MEVQILEFDYKAGSVSDIQSRLNNYLTHNDVQDVQVTRDGDKLLVFCFRGE